MQVALMARGFAGRFRRKNEVLSHRALLVIGRTLAESGYTSLMCIPMAGLSAKLVSAYSAEIVRYHWAKVIRALASSL